MFCMSYIVVQAQFGEYSLIVEELNFTNAPELQSYGLGNHEGKYLLIGGRKDGLHQRQPFAAFLASDNNVNVYVIDIETQQVWSASLSALSTALQEQLQSTNMEHYQDGDVLYLIGGYGYSSTLGDHTTYASLVAVDVPACIDAVINGQNIAPHFKQLNDSRLQVTGGYLSKLGSKFYLVGGQKFIGRYNPMGPTHGPGFIQEYTNAIKTFEIVNGTNLQISNYSETIDTVNLHRRDYNMLPQVFPNGDYGYTAFSGVFQYGADLPWLNIVDITENNYQVHPSFNQYLNQYHTASCPLYSESSNEMFNIFFGGISRYYIDANGVMQDDVNVPFVNTISVVQRNSSGDMTEIKIGEMPALLGSGAEFIAHNDIVKVFNQIIDIDALNGDTVSIGYILGGIESSAANIFFINDGSQSNASNRLFEVFLYKNDTGTSIGNMLNEDIDFRLSPNPASKQMSLSFNLENKTDLLIDIFDTSGIKAQIVANKSFKKGKNEIELPVGSLAKGKYFLRIFDGIKIRSIQFVLQ